MALGHEKLDVYRLAIDYVAWVFKRAESLKGLERHARDQWLRASQSIPLNIAEGNGKATEPDRRRFFEIARGSAFECAAIQDVLVASKALSKDSSDPQKLVLDRIAAMLSRLGKRGYAVDEDQAVYGDDSDMNEGEIGTRDRNRDRSDTESDTDSDSDTDLYSDRHRDAPRI